MGELEIGTELRSLTQVRKSQKECAHMPMQAMKMIETDYGLVVSLSLKFAGQILGDPMRQEMRRGQRPTNALMKDMVTKGEICQHQEWSKMERAGEMGRCEKTGNLASHCSGCHCFLLSGLTEPAIKQTKQTVKQINSSIYTVHTVHHM